MDLRQLRYFLAVADAGHITRAAQALGIQQPPLSQQIRALERELGVGLFVRHPKGVTLTEAGQLLRREASRLIGDFDGVIQRMRAYAGGRAGVVVVGFTSSAAMHAYTPHTLRLCRQRHPDIEVQVREANAAELTEALEARAVHCAFLRVPVARPRGIAFETLLHEPSWLAIPADHPLARQPTRPVALKELDGQRLILVRRPGAPGLYANLLAACERQGVQVEMAAEVERMMTNLNLVAAGVGLSLVPASMRGAHPQAIVYRPMPASARLDSPLTLAFRRGDAEGPTGTVLALAREVARQYREARSG